MAQQKTATLAPGGGVKGQGNTPDTTQDPNLVDRYSTPMMKFLNTTGAQKYGSYYMNFLQKAQATADGSRLFIPKGAIGNGGDLYFGSRGPNGEDFLSGGEFAQLQSDYSNWMSAENKSSQDYANYVGLMQSNPGRDGTILGTQLGQQQPTTLLGSARSTVFG